jgi:hypothetical protein
MHRFGRIAPRDRGLTSGHTAIASEAKQSISQREERMDCFAAFAPRNDGVSDKPRRIGYLVCGV